jgi:intracellular sulfur oxidation DsrE/DsrF family protein
MSDESLSTLRRRGVLGRLLSSSIAVAAGTLPAAPLLAESRRRDEAAGGLESAHAALIREAAGAADTDMSWVPRITAPRRVVFDCAEIEEGVALHHARITLANYAEIEKTTDADWSVVLTIRHAAVPMLANDVLWGKYVHLGKSTRLKDPATGKRAMRNPFLNANVRESDRYALIWPDGGLDTMVQRGAIVLACGMALRRLSRELADDTKQEPKAVHQEVLANLVPGVYVMPSGIFATVRAQEAGCRLFKSS